MNRSTISQHTLSSGDAHLDIFFQTGEILETYEAALKGIEELKQQKKVECNRKQPHRINYLDYEGEISNGRGSIKILWSGFYKGEENSFPDRIVIFFTDQDNLKIEIIN